MKSAIQQRFHHRLSELATRLPWWGGLLSALAAYALLHPIAGLQMPAPIGTVDMVASALAQLLIFLAGLGQYLLPLVFLVSAAISGYGRWRRDELRDSVMQDTSGSILRGLPRRDFELLVGDAFRRQGYEVRIPQGDVGTQYRVIELTREGQCFLVDCTDWRSWKAGINAVRRLHEHINELDVTGGFAVSSGLFTPEAKHFAADVGIQLFDGRHLKELVGAEDEPTKSDSSPMRRQLQAILSNWGQRITDVLRRSPPEPPVYGPVIQRSPRISTTADDRTISITDLTEPTLGDDAVTSTGRELAALIRAERRTARESELSVPSDQGYDPTAPHPRRARPRFRIRNLTDAAGMLLTLTALWGIYEWFLTLPTETAATPWALLGAGSDSDVLMRRLQGFTRTRSVAGILGGKEPLGQYQFGPPQGFLTQARPQLPVPEVPVEVYHSLRELETAFEVKYVPPPECYGYESSTKMVKCGNHRIRARRTFVSTGGKVTPILLGSWEEPPEIPTETPGQDWRRYDENEWQPDSSEEWQTTREWEQDRPQEPIPQFDQDRRSAWTPEPAQDWQQEQSQGSEEDWERDWRSEPEPIEGRHWVDDL